MAADPKTRIVVVQGRDSGRQFTLGDNELILGRSSGADIQLEGSNVSRRHARVWREGREIYVEDLGSSNGTFVNDARITGRFRLSSRDTLRVGSYLLRLAEEQPLDVTIQQQALARTSNFELFRENAAVKLQAVLELSQHLTNSLETSVLLDRLVRHLLTLFPHADRALVFSFESGEISVLAFRDRLEAARPRAPFSRTLLRKIWESGIAVLAEDTADLRDNVSINALGIRSLVCAPLAGQQGRVFGAIQLDSFEARRPFGAEDLHLLTTVALQVAVVLENAKLHRELLANERVIRELATAREIQESFLPSGPLAVAAGAVELHAELHPAFEVAGDLYDYVALDGQRILLVVGDVSGKGIAAALFMAMVRALLRQFAKSADRPSQILAQLNRALAEDNPKFMFVTLLVGIYDLNTGNCVVSRGGHPAALLRTRQGQIRPVESRPGYLLGFDPGLQDGFVDLTVQLEPGDCLVFYTDGVTEAASPDTGEEYGEKRLHESLRHVAPAAPLPEWSTQLRGEVAKFSQQERPQDDLTMLFLRRLPC